MAVTDTYHNIETYAVEGAGMFSARCKAHDAATAERWPTARQAARGFFCDEGRNLRFITVFTGESLDMIPGMCDLSGLARTIRADAEAHAQMQKIGQTSAWLWGGEGHLMPLVISLDPAAQTTPFGADDWLHRYVTQRWNVTTEDGTVILSVPDLPENRL